MDISKFEHGQLEQVENLYTDTFTVSEGPDEGSAIGALVTDLVSTTNNADLVGFVASTGEEIVGCIFFSRLTLTTNKLAYLLSPVAINAAWQQKGVGQRLINYGLQYLQSQGVDFALTYGDPRFYAKVGFKKISEQEVKPPFKLSQPEGWLAQPINGGSVDDMKGALETVAAFNNADYW